MIGYLISQFLISEFENDSGKFLTRYKAFLMDSGMMSVEDLLQNTSKKMLEIANFGFSVWTMLWATQMSLKS